MSDVVDALTGLKLLVGLSFPNKIFLQRSNMRRNIGAVGYRVTVASYTARF